MVKNGEKSDKISKNYSKIMKIRVKSAKISQISTKNEREKTPKMNQK